MSCAAVAHRFVETLEARDWDAWYALLHPDVIYEIPQSRERIRGRDRYLQFNREFPGGWHLRPKRVVSDDTHAVVWFAWVVDDGPEEDAVVFLSVQIGLVTEVVDFWPEAYEPPPGREHLVERW